jgi:nucleotide-binding universal stress UspA family protein
MPTAVLIAREPISAPRRVLLAVDGSPASAAAAGMLAGFPLAAGAEVDIVTVLADWPDLTRDQGAADLCDLGALERRHVGEVIGQAETILGSSGRSGHPLVREGDAKREILEVASERGSDLIVLGARGLGGFKGLILGSVSRAVSKAAPCSTLVVPASPRGT